MTDQAAYRRYTANAEKILNTLHTTDAELKKANIWARLALAAAQERVQPADRPIDLTEKPLRVIDGEGDTWYLHMNGYYGLELGREGQQATTTLDQIAKAHGGYTEVT